MAEQFQNLMNREIKVEPIFKEEEQLQVAPLEQQEKQMEAAPLEQQKQQEEELLDTEDFLILTEEKEKEEMKTPSWRSMSKTARKRAEKSMRYTLKQRRKVKMAKAKQEYQDSTLNAMKKSMDAFSERDEFQVINHPDLTKLKEEHTVKTKTTIKKRTFKKDEVITERVVVDKEEKTRLKRAIAKKMTANYGFSVDKKVKARRNVDILHKKHLDYSTFETISDFAPLMQGEKEFEDLVNQFSIAEMEKKKAKTNKQPEVDEKRLKENTIPAMNIITEKIMKINAAGFDLSSDQALAEQSDKLEEIARASVAYRKLLSQNPEYMDYVFSQKNKKGQNLGELLTRQLDQLTAVADYYRLRKIVIEDELYQSLANEEISIEDEKTDSVQMKRLKRMMRASYQAGMNLEQAFGGGGEVPKIDLKTDDTIGILRRGKLQLDKKDMQKSAEGQLKMLVNQSDVISQLESERYFQAPRWMRESMTLDPKKIPKQNKDKNPALAICGPKSDMTMAKVAIKEFGKQELWDKWAKLTGKNGRDVGANPKFEGAKDKKLGDMEISDNWNRLFAAFTTVYSYKNTDEEMMEMADLLSIQSDKEKWKEIQKDPEAVAFYESAFREMSKKMIFAAYAGSKRFAETLGGKMNTMHPADICMQMTTKMHVYIMGNSVITNIVKPGNTEKVIELFEEDKESKYAFDAEDFEDMSNVMSNMDFKIQGFENCMRSVTKDVDSEELAEISKKIFGDPKYFDKVIDPEYKKYLADGNKLSDAWPKKMSSDAIMTWYLNRHPEYITTKAFKNKAFGKHVADAYGQGMSGTEASLYNLVKKGKIDYPTDEEFDAYEKHLQKEGYLKLRVNDKDDDPNDMINIDTFMKRTKGIKIQKKVIMDNREKDPYGVKLIKNKMSELIYKDDNTGKTYFRTGIGQV